MTSSKAILPEELLDELFGGVLADVFTNQASPFFDGIAAPGVKLYRKTRYLRQAILAALDTVEKPVTVRQAYYLVASRGDCEKTAAGYNRVQRQILAMRREDIIDYGWIADNTRWRIEPTAFNGLSEFFERQRKFYRQDLWSDSEDYVEVWCEKDSIAGVLSDITSEYAVGLLPARGYSSETFAYEAAEAMRRTERNCFVYYVGDFDPSGWDASRDLKDRLIGFFPEVQFSRLAINHDDMPALQTRETKHSDTRTKRFFQAYGDGTPSAELEAMNPDELRARVRTAIENHISEGLIEAKLLEEKAARETLNQFAKLYAT